MSSFNNKLERMAHALFHPFGFELTRLTAAISWYSAFSRLKKKEALDIETFVDIGASDGQWSEIALRYFKDSYVLLIEAQPYHEKALKEFCKRHERSSYVLSAAGDHVGSVFFDEGGDPLGGGVARQQSADSSAIEVEMTTVDHEVEKNNLKGPFCLKLDTHGFELPIFEGAAKTLEQCAIVAVEVYNIAWGPDVLLFYEMCEYMKKKGFRPIDLCKPMYRPKDGVLWQFDLIFARSDRREYLLRSYK